MSRRHVIPVTVAVLLAGTVVATPPAVASHAGPVYLGDLNTAPRWTQITNNAGNGSGTALYLFGSSATPGDGLYSVGHNGSGVWAYSYQKDGVVGTGARHGVVGNSSSTSGSGVYGENTSTGRGVEARSNGIAMLGESTGGMGVQGRATSQSGIGVYGETEAPNGTGVLGNATQANGTGVRALSTNGTALAVDGKASFSRSGKLTVPAGATSVVKTGVALTSASMVLATLQQRRSGLWVQAAVPSPGSASFTLYLNKAAPASTTVAWFVLD
jgi:hypothetical protein